MTKKYLAAKERYLKLVEKTLDEVLPGAGERPAVLSEAMRYAVGTGGKRIRPLVCFGSAVAAGGKAADARYAAAAIELLHNYTLVHDDLPAMDNDTLRRGKPTVWKKFGEDNAILAGDALQAQAFMAASLCPKNADQVVHCLAIYAKGVVDGQIEDIAKGEKDADYIYLHKTADLFIASAFMGAACVDADDDVMRSLGMYAASLGLAFQLQDDLLDGDGLYDREGTKERIKSCTGRALGFLKLVPGDTSFLKELAEELLNRKK